VFVPEVSLAVRRSAGFDSGWYGNFVEDERVLDRSGTADPNSALGEGWMTYPHHPRFGSNYRGLGGRLDLLLECYSYLGFEERVKTSYAWLHEILRAVARRASEITALVQRCKAPPAHVAVRYRLEATPEPVEILTRQPRTLEGQPVSVHLPFLARFMGDTVIERPLAYIVPARLGDFLRGHGLALEPAPVAARVASATLTGLGATPGRAILEAAGVGRRQVDWAASTRHLPPGALLLRTEQPLGALAVYLCEPESDDGLVEGGYLPTPSIGEEFEVLRWLE
jgi:hypothetical protein